MNSLLIGPGLPGGMMGSLMGDLQKNIASLNKWLEKNNKPTITEDDLLIKLFDEVEHIWPKMGYPPLVTPYSQYVKNVALMNVMQMIKGKERWSMIDDNTWDMLLGNSGKVPGPVADELKELAKQQGREFSEDNPQDKYPDQLPVFKKEMDEKGWDYGQDDEELFELAMHPPQYRDYKSGKAKKDFEADLAQKRGQAEKPASQTTVPAIQTSAAASLEPKTLNIDVNGERFVVNVSYGDQDTPQAQSAAPKTSAQPAVSTPSANSGTFQEILAPIEGKFFLTKSPGDTPVKVGDLVKSGDVIGYIESMKVYNAVTSDMSGKIVEIVATNGEAIDEDDVLIRLQ